MEFEKLKIRPIVFVLFFLGFIFHQFGGEIGLKAMEIFKDALPNMFNEAPKKE